MQDLANKIELAVLAFFQDRGGFNEWWHSLDATTQSALEQNLIDLIYDYLQPAIQADAKISNIIGWLENNQPDVFSRGLWDAIRTA